MSFLIRALLLSFIGVASAMADGSAYYRELNYRRNPIDTGDGFQTRYNKLVSYRVEEIRISENRILFIDLKLYLLPEDRYLLSYHELYHVRRNANSEWQLDLAWPGNCPKILKGSWTAPEQKLLAQDHPFTADRHFSGGRPTVKITFQSPVVSPAVLGREFPFEWEWSGNAMEHELGFFGCAF